MDLTPEPPPPALLRSSSPSAEDDASPERRAENASPGPDAASQPEPRGRLCISPFKKSDPQHSGKVYIPNEGVDKYDV